MNEHDYIDSHNQYNDENNDSNSNDDSEAKKKKYIKIVMSEEESEDEGKGYQNMKFSKKRKSPMGYFNQVLSSQPS